MNKDYGTDKELAYFKENPGYRRIFKGIYGKYRSLGRLGGTVTLRNLTKEEREVLGSHLKRDYSRKQSTSFSVRSFEESLDHTRFAGYSLEEILEWYFDVDLVSRAEEEGRFVAQRDEELETLREIYRGQPGEIWVDALQEGDALGKRRFMMAYSNERKELLKSTHWVLKALKLLGDNGAKSQYLRLPVLASLITLDPHAFDEGMLAGDLLMDALCVVHGLSKPEDNQERAEVYYRGGILVDDISNFVTLSGLMAYRANSPHPVWQAALGEGEMLQVPLCNLAKIDEISSPIGKVFVVENPAVFSGILESLGDQGQTPPLVCSYGQLKLSCLVLLDKLARSDTQIYYSGDFDPEGLLIAQKLSHRYKNRFRPWRYDVEDYRGVQSGQKISARRLSMLKGLVHPTLARTGKEIKGTMRSGYQELLIGGLSYDVQKAMEMEGNR